ncbi:tudor domain-containing protein 1-like [Amyelois transitella]|uniref:tudor domain-containing protein 1-like n=1 Tax=Amyelois transitella TaxID=680683 RepID=UPI00299078E7|nr:tudor domain-containing protein 1-like [Amyelois transitella]
MPQHCQSTPNDLRNVVNENNHFSHNIYNNYYHTTNNYQNRVMHQNMLRYEDSSLRTFIREQYNTTREDILRQPPPYHAQQYIREHPNHIVTANPVEQPYFSSGPDLTRSSVSTDSGFISPGRSKSDNNSVEDIMNDLFELENMVQSRKSSHSVICHVCQKNSKLLCSACYKTNYCSVKCQRTDWDVHKVLCRP